MIKHKQVTVTGAALLMSVGVAHGQTATVPSSGPVAADAQAASPGDIIVTATRERTTAQKAAAPINVISGATIDALRIDSVADMTGLVPGLKIDGNSKDQLRLGLRGAFASSNTPGAGQAVGLYIDEIPYIHTSNLGNPLFGIRQIEVLRGPQGTLYGQNVTGGLINIRTADPTDTLEAEGRASYSSFNRIDLAGMVSGPVAGKIDGALSVYGTRSDGWERNLVTGNKLDQLRTFGARLKLLWRPTDQFSLKFIGEYDSDKTRGIVRNFVLGSPARFTVPDWKQTYLAYDGGYDSHDMNIGVIAEYKAGSATLSSITSYQRNRPFVSRQPFVTDPVSYQTDDRANPSDTYTEELRVAGLVGHLNYQFGAFVLDDDAIQIQTYHTRAAPGTTLFATVPTDNLAMPNFEVQARSYSLFGTATYHLGSVISLAAGGRYNWDSKHAILANSGTPSAAVGIFNAPAPYIAFNQLRSQQFSPKVTLSAAWSNLGFFDDLLLYGTFSKGYRTGDFSTGTTLANSLSIAQPEIAKNFEAGFKSTFANRAITLNATAFHVQYKNLQTLTTAAVTGTVTIASTDAVAKGIEVGLTVRPFAGFNISADYAYLNTKVANGAFVGTVNVSGAQLPQSPPNSFDITAVYIANLGRDSKLRFTGAYTYKDPVYFDVRNARTLAVRDLTKVVNLDGEIALLHGRWEFSVWGKNLTDRAIVIRSLGTVQTASLSPAETAAGKIAFDGVYSDPRSIGASIKFKY